jgi:hypothetical protein
MKNRWLTCSMEDGGSGGGGGGGGVGSGGGVGGGGGENIIAICVKGSY